MNLQKLQKQSYVRIIMGLSILCSTPSAMMEGEAKPIINGPTVVTALAEEPVPVQVLEPRAQQATGVERLRRALTPTRSLTPSRTLKSLAAAMSPFNRASTAVEYDISTVYEKARIEDMWGVNLESGIHIMRASIQKPVGQVEEVPYSSLLFFPLALFMAQKKKLDLRLMAHCLVNCPEILSEDKRTIYLIDKTEGSIRTSGLMYNARDAEKSKQSMLKAEAMAKETTTLFEAPVINFAALEKYLSSKEAPKLPNIDWEFINADKSSILPNHSILTSSSSSLEKWLTLMYAEEHTRDLAKKVTHCEREMRLALRKAETADREAAILRRKGQDLELQIQELMNRAANAATEFAEQQARLEEEYKTGKALLQEAEKLETKIDTDLADERESFKAISQILEKLIVIVEAPDSKSKQQELKELVSKFKTEKEKVTTAGKNLDIDSKEMLKCLEEVFDHVAAADGIIHSGLNLLRAGFGLVLSVLWPLGIKKALQDSLPESVTRRLLLRDETTRKVRRILKDAYAEDTK